MRKSWVGLQSLSRGDLRRAGAGAGAVWAGKLRPGSVQRRCPHLVHFPGPAPEVGSLGGEGFPLGSQVRVIRYPWPVLLPASLTQVPIPLSLVFVLGPVEELDPKGLGCVASP